MRLESHALPESESGETPGRFFYEDEFICALCSVNRLKFRRAMIRPREKGFLCPESEDVQDCLVKRKRAVYKAFAERLSA